VSVDAIAENLRSLVKGQVDAVIQLLVRAGNARLLLLRNAGANQMRVNVVGRYQCLANFTSILGETWRYLFFESLIRFEVLDYLFEVSALSTYFPSPGLQAHFPCRCQSGHER
jgi:hypothetical protein